MKEIIITGIRGIPAAHGGFETFAENLALYLVDKGWKVTVYCQEDSGEFYIDSWNGVQLIHIPVKNNGALGTIIFDFKSIIHSLKEKKLVLTLGYNTAIFNSLYFLRGRKNVINMDGIEWKRDKWGIVAKSWFWMNERFGCWFGNHLIADHPKIKEHLATRVNDKKITMIPYGAHAIGKNNSNSDVLRQYGLDEKKYFLVIARPEPENSILEIVRGFSLNKNRTEKLVVLGNYDFLNNEYHKKIKESANENVLFLGAIYNASSVSTLRYYALAYIHGHRVGGTNPSLVESLGSGNAIIAHDNKFNRWVVGDSGIFFTSDETCAAQMDYISSNEDIRLNLEAKAKEMFNEKFTWDLILSQYEALLEDWL
ncbi:DUF1972 domain-containing protein [Klebsiella electrica]|uniref:DUF1972 domain-containing protein n=1 Tax=Klebsiella electrica TaxID=1259973 RepID=UPI002557C6CB|nr:DUF1972 domain-containing protein [Klebsiella electrica]WIO41747.1 DUF1972 domain-containing protein [Klebsiella electrica]